MLERNYCWAGQNIKHSSKEVLRYVNKAFPAIVYVGGLHVKF